MSVYEFSVKARDGSDVPLSDYKGKVLLIVNTATECGFTSQYKELEGLYEKYGPKGLEILDFPCDQFNHQAPGTDDEIHDFCTGRFGITFPQFSKVDVVGKNAIPLFRWLSDNTTFEGFGKSPKALALSIAVRRNDQDYKDSSDVKWNFTKFLVDREGYVVDRFEPTDMRRLEGAIERYL